MNRYEYTEWENDDGALVGLLSESENGDYVQYDDVEPIIADRDIKTANLQLLVDAVLDYHTMVEGAVGGEDDIDALEARRMLGLLVDLARGLKQ